MISDNAEDLQFSPAADLTQADVQRRVDDWLTRLNEFIRINTDWAIANGWQVVPAGSIPMHEELMRKYNVSPVDQPTLRIENNNKQYALFKPKGLWVIGANGRIDLYTPKGAFIVVDQASRFSPPDWRIFSPSDKRNGLSYSPDMLPGLV